MKLTSSELTFQKRFLFITLAVVLISSFLAYHVQTAGGTVKVQAMKIPTQDGQWVVVDLFKPESATAQKPAPLVFVIPGFQRSKEALANVAIELARRSIVAISIDPYAQGFSSASMSTRSATTEGYGLYALVDYFRNTDILNYIDRDRIGATGHSAGGNAVISGASYFGKLAQQTGMPSKLHAVYCSGYVLCMIKNKLKDIRSNVGAAYAFYDEGSYRNELRNADMRFAPEALRLINMSFPDSLEPVQEVEIGHYYGNTDDRTLRVMYNERIIHPFQPYQIEAMANQMEFWDRVLDIDSELSYWNQIWYWKELMGIIAMVASLIALIPLARLLLRTSYFSDLVHPLPPAQPRLTGTGRIIFWGLFVLGALIACFTFIPMAELSKKWFVEASTRHQTWFFPQRMNNAVLLWAILNGSVGFLLFWLSYRFFGKSHGIDPGMWGIKISWRKLRKTFGLAFMLYLFYYLLLGLIYYVLHVDYRFLFMGVRLFQPAILVLLAMYAPFFFIFFLSNSLRTNGAMRFDGQSEWRSMLLAGLGNSLGLLLIVIIQYTAFAVTGMVHWTDGWLYVNLLFAVVPMMFFLPYFNRIFFRMTGRIYLGPMVTCLILIMILLTNTVVYIPI